MKHMKKQTEKTNTNIRPVAGWEWVWNGTQNVLQVIYKDEEQDTAQIEEQEGQK